MIKRVFGSKPRSARPERLAVLTTLTICLGLLIYRGAVIHHNWLVLRYHVDGALLIAALLALMTNLLQWTRRVSGVEVFAIPLLFLLLTLYLCF